MTTAGVEKLLPVGTRIVRIFTAPEIESGAVVLPEWDAPGMVCCKERSRGRAVRGCGVFIKEYIYTSFWQRMRRRFGTPRPFIVLAAAEQLAKSGVPTPRVLVALRGIMPGGGICDLLVTEELPSSAVFGNIMLRDSLPSERAAIAAALAPVVAQMHRYGIVHGDLSLRNWYLDRCKWGVIDLDGTKLCHRVSLRQRSDEVARVASSCFMATLKECDNRDSFLHCLLAFVEYYRSSGGAVLRNYVERRSLYLVNRARRKYLKAGKLK